MAKKDPGTVNPFAGTKRKTHIAIFPLDEKGFTAWLKKQPAATKQALAQSTFKGAARQTHILRNKSGNIEAILAGVNMPIRYYDLSASADYIRRNIPAAALKTCSFHIAGKMNKADMERAAIGWGWAAYQFTAYKNNSKPVPALLLDKNIDKTRVLAFTDSLTLLRDLINTPANDMGPDELEAAARQVAKKFTATISVTKDNAQVKKNFPMVHAVGDGSPRRPRMIDIRWGNKRHPKVTLVGKGVCFDTGGLNLKPGQYMRLMKKDMAGGAHVLALGWLIMSLRIPVQLRILIPAVENAVSGAAFRPGDILKSRKGLSVENTNTDAEGRLILADALTYACENKPDLLVDFSTLTGSARAALGQDIPAFFSNSDSLAEKLKAISLAAEDPLWPMPLWAPYKKHIESPIADLVNSADIPGDLIYSALFLQSFLSGKPDWVHLDMFAWESAGFAGRPKGGADTGMRAVFALIEQRYGKKKKP